MVQRVGQSPVPHVQMLVCAAAGAPLRWPGTLPCKTSTPPRTCATHTAQESNSHSPPGWPHLHPSLATLQLPPPPGVALGQVFRDMINGVTGGKYAAGVGGQPKINFKVGAHPGCAGGLRLAPVLFRGCLQAATTAEVCDVA